MRLHSLRMTADILVKPGHQGQKYHSLIRDYNTIFGDKAAEHMREANPFLVVFHFARENNPRFEAAVIDCWLSLDDILPSPTACGNKTQWAAELFIPISRDKQPVDIWLPTVTTVNSFLGPAGAVVLRDVGLAVAPNPRLTPVTLGTIYQTYKETVRRIADHANS